MGEWTIMRRLWLLILLWCSAPWAHTEIRVGGYPFAPFVEKGPGGQWYGLTLDLIAALNRSQPDYRFIFVPTSSAQRYKALDIGRFDMMMFEDLKWGWHDHAVQASSSYYLGGEVYVAMRAPGRDQRFFEDVTRHRLIGVEGYHYGFSQFEGDPAHLRQRFRITLVKDNHSTLRALQLGRGDVAVLTRAYLDSQLAREPALAEQLLISTRLDQRYQLRMLIAPAAPIALPVFEQMMQSLTRQGVAATLWRRYGLAPRSVP